MEVTLENWNYSFYKKDQHKAFVCLCAEPTEITEVSDQNIAIQYALTVTDSDDNELFQQNYQNLNEAIQNLNKRYQIWEFFDLSQKSEGSGCGTCSAH